MTNVYIKVNLLQVVTQLTFILCPDMDQRKRIN